MPKRSLSRRHRQRDLSALWLESTSAHQVTTASTTTSSTPSAYVRLVHQTSNSTISSASSSKSSSHVVSQSSSSSLTATGDNRIQQTTTTTATTAALSCSLQRNAPRQVSDDDIMSASQVDRHSSSSNCSRNTETQQQQERDEEVMMVDDNDNDMYDCMALRAVQQEPTVPESISSHLKRRVQPCICLVELEQQNKSNKNENITTTTVLVEDYLEDHVPPSPNSLWGHFVDMLLPPSTPPVAMGGIGRSCEPYPVPATTTAATVATYGNGQEDLFYWHGPNHQHHPAAAAAATTTLDGINWKHQNEAALEGDDDNDGDGDDIDHDERPAQRRRRSHSVPCHPSTPIVINNNNNSIPRSSFLPHWLSPRPAPLPSPATLGNRPAPARYAAFFHPYQLSPPSSSPHIMSSSSSSSSPQPPPPTTTSWGMLRHRDSAASPYMKSIYLDFDKRILETQYAMDSLTMD